RLECHASRRPRQNHTETYKLLSSPSLLIISSLILVRIRQHTVARHGASNAHRGLCSGHHRGSQRRLWLQPPAPRPRSPAPDAHAAGHAGRHRRLRRRHCHPVERAVPQDDSVALQDARHRLPRVWPRHHRRPHRRPRQVHQPRPQRGRRHAHAGRHQRHHPPCRLPRLLHHRRPPHLLWLQHCRLQDRQHRPRRLLPPHHVVGEARLAHHPHRPPRHRPAHRLLVHRPRRGPALRRSLHRRHVLPLQRLGHLRRPNHPQGQLVRRQRLRQALRRLLPVLGRHLVHHLRPRHGRRHCRRLGRLFAVV
ncbi:hypothetical protein TOPH_03751, partial [Tolypocladium ophioglossoides CBS 100239]